MSEGQARGWQPAPLWALAKSQARSLPASVAALGGLSGHTPPSRPACFLEAPSKIVWHIWGPGLHLAAPSTPGTPAEPHECFY